MRNRQSRADQTFQVPVRYILLRLGPRQTAARGVGDTPVGITISVSPANRDVLVTLVANLLKTEPRVSFSRTDARLRDATTAVERISIG